MRWCLKLYFALFLLFSFPGNLLSQINPKEIDKVLTEFFNEGKFQGTVLIGNDSGIVYEKGFGYANAEYNIPNTPQTKFRIASITKSFTSMLVMQLAQEGKIKLNGKITDYLPDYPAKTGSKITIHHLLSHTSGLGHYEMIPGFYSSYSYLPFRHTDFLKLFKDAPLLFEPGSRYNYSSLGYYLLGVILEKISGESYEDLLKERIFNRLGMSNTSVDNCKRIEKNRAMGYENTRSGLQNAEYRNMSTALATGDILSTVRDLYIWDRALYTDKLLPASIRDILFKPNLNSYGYGWSINNTALSDGNILKGVSHTGTTNGFRSIICRFLNKHTVIIMLCNSDNSDVSLVSEALKNVLFENPQVVKKNQ